jgi:hypothetical protein
MRRSSTIRRVVLATIGILVAAAALWWYTVLASIRPTTMFVNASIFLPLAALVCFCFVRAIVGWKRFGTWRRVYAVVTVAASSSLLVAFVANLAGEPGFASRYFWAVWKIERLGGRIQIDEVRTQDAFVSLDGPQVTDADLAYVVAIAPVRSLRLMDTQVTDAGLQQLQGLTHLCFLRLEFANVTDAGVEHLAQLKELQSLNLANTKVTDAGVERLKGLTKLQSLDLRDTNVTDAGVKRLQRALPKCEITH